MEWYNYILNCNISEMTIIFRGKQLFSCGKDFERKFGSSTFIILYWIFKGELHKFTSNIRAVAPCAEGDLAVRK